MVVWLVVERVYLGGGEVEMDSRQEQASKGRWLVITSSGHSLGMDRIT